MKLILRRFTACILACFPVFGILHSQQEVSPPSGWEAFPGFLHRITPPVFPARDYDVTKFGAVGDGKTDCTNAFKKAIDKCTIEGGGRVVVPAGVFLSGPIHLKSDVNLYVSRGATIRFSADPRRYLPVVYTRWEGVECMNYSPLIYAYEQKNIAVTGEGILDGQGSNEHWWSWKGRKDMGWAPGMPHQNDARQKLFEMGEDGIPVAGRVFGEGSYLRPSFFQPYRCASVLLEGVTFRNSPMWFLNPILCENVSIIGVTTEGHGPNNDGCDPESCKDILIRNCHFDTGDDCIAIKSGRNADGRRINVPCENVIVQGCTMKDGHGGVSIGSEMSGGVRNVYAENDTMDSPVLERMLRIKSNSKRGGFVENVFFRDIRVGQVADAVVQIDFYYEEGDSGTFTPVVRNIDLRNIESNKSRFAVWIRAYDRSPATDVRIEHCRFNNVAEANVIENVKNFSLIDVVTSARKSEGAAK